MTVMRAVPEPLVRKDHWAAVFGPVVVPLVLEVSR
jgi:hypothetical protein